MSLLLCKQSRNLNCQDVNNIIWELMFDVPLCLVPESPQHGVLITLLVIGHPEVYTH